MGCDFQREGPLDMRFSPQQEVAAAEIVNGRAESALADVLWRYGEESRSRRIAKRIVERRPLRTTTELAKVVEEAVGRRARRLTHPATRTFQALRIAVNQELLRLETALPHASGLLGDLGRLSVLSYHSLAARLVKTVRRPYSVACPRLPRPRSPRRPKTAPRSGGLQSYPPTRRSTRPTMAVTPKTTSEHKGQSPATPTKTCSTQAASSHSAPTGPS